MDKRPVALVTGASRGIGKAIALALADQGYDIAGLSRTLEQTSEKQGLLNLQPELEARGAQFLPLQGDIGDIHRHPVILAEILRQLGRIDLLVNNAGQAPAQRRDVLETHPDSFDRVLETNLRGTFFLTQTVAREMVSLRGRLKKYQPRIVFITSISAVVSSTNRAEYCIAKAGLSMTARLFADRLLESGVGVFEVRPGIIATDMTKPVKKKYDELIAGGLIPQGRWGQPEDVAKAVSAIARGDFDYATGAVIEISGGMDLRRL